MLRILVACLACSLLAAGESAAVTAFKQAMAGDDGTAKQQAARALASKDAGEDWDVLPLLVQAASDRQAQQAAIDALRSRTGLTRPARGKGGTGYPGYPVTDDGPGWSAWLAGWQKANPKKEAPKKPAATPAAGPTGETPAEGTPGETAAPPVAPPPRIPTDDLGRLDRIVYKSGRSLIAFVRSKRLDGDGNLVSVRVVHRDGVGEEVVDAGVIARIEEDIE